MTLTASVTSGRLFSHFVGRVAGFPASSFDQLRARQSLAVHTAMREAGELLEEAQADVGKALFTSIQGLEDRALRRIFLRLKRDVHNRRPICLEPLTNRLETSGRKPMPDLERALARYRSAQAARQGLALKWRDVFDREVVDIRRRFQKLVDVEDFRRGLLLSSRTLAKELSRYIRTTSERPGSRVRKVERSLMRYFSRAAMKSSPFSTFCALVPGTFARGDVDAADAFRGDPFRKQGLLRINKAIYARALDHLLQRSGVRPHFHVELNPTLRQETRNRWLFLSASNGRETFQRLPCNPVLDELRRQLSQGDLSLGELTSRLIDDPTIEADHASVTRYLDRLFEIGFLRFRVGIPEQEVDWDRPLAAILEGVEDEHAVAIHRLLASLRAGVDRYATSSARQREEILTAIDREISTVDRDLEIELLPRGQSVFYEDAGGSANLRLDLDDLEDILVEYVALVSRMAWPRAEQASMRHFFESYYGPEHDPVSLLRFYEDYYREHFKEHLGHERSPREARPTRAKTAQADDRPEKAYDVGNPFGLAIVDAIAQGGRALSEHIRQRWHAAPDAEEICLEREDLQSILDGVPEEGASHRSASLFVQWVPNFGANGESALVANNAFNGYGKYFSRFLSVLPDEVRLALIENNRQLTDRELAEICGDSAFNGNLHPPLLPREISYPTGESGDAEDQIPSAEIEVARDPLDPHRLRLQETNGNTRIVPVDLGFLNPRMRPPLYQLLSRFTPPANAQVAVPDSPDDTSHQAPPGQAPTRDHLGDSGIRHRPRITYRGRLILARRQWQISLASFPHRGKKETEADYFLRIQEWRHALCLPDEVFLRIWPLPAPQPAEPTDNAAESTEESDGAEVAPEQTPGGPTQRFRQHLYKPQYIDFRNPLLVDLFSRATENLEHARLTFEERLPRGDQLIESDGKRCVTELVVQVDFPQSEFEPKQDGPADA